MFNYEVVTINSPIGNGALKGNPSPDSSCNIAPAPQEREAQVSEQFQYMQREIQFQREVVGALFSRLQPVMAPTQPDSTGEKQNEPTCAMAAVLSRFSADIRSNTAGLNEILRRLEI